MPGAHPQLTLALDTAPATSFGTFHVGEGNAVAYRSVTAFVDGSSVERQIFLWGEAGGGKSHLLSAACQAVSAQGYRIAYLPGELASHREALVGLEQCELLCVDDLQRLAHAAEIDLCHCIDRCRAAGTMLLFAADRPPEALALALTELRSRLDLGPRFQVGALVGEALREALRREAARRSLELGDDVIDHLIKRFAPSMAVLRPVLDTLDGASLSTGRRLSVSLVRSVFGPAGGASRAPVTAPVTASVETAEGDRSGSGLTA